MFLLVLQRDVGEVPWYTKKTVLEQTTTFMFIPRAALADSLSFKACKSLKRIHNTMQWGGGVCLRYDTSPV